MKTTIINKILLVLMLITAQQVSALEFQVDGIYYRTSIFTKNSAYVTHSGNSYTESVEYQGEVVIPESVTYNGKTYTIASIGGYAFAGCPGLTSVTIPNTVTTINQNAFNGCTGLKTIECKATTPPALGDNAFTSYDATLVVPSSSESAYKSAAGWSNFKFKEEPSETPGSGENSGEDSGSDNSGSDNTYGLACKILNSTDVAIIAGSEKYTGDIVIPSQVTISGKTYTVTSIANDAFKGCTGLTSITIPSSITSIGSSSFDSCNNLNKVNISDILSWCKITFANSLANPLYYAKKLYLNGTLVTKLEIPSAITEIKNYTFYNCTSISTIVFPSGILKIGNSAFVNCSNMTSVTIPNSVTTIDENAFNGCTGLASLTIGSSVGSIGNYAFGNCTGLKSVTSLNSTPPTCGTGVFQGVTISSIPLTVPAGSESLYKATYTWQDFKYKEESENPDDDPAVDTSGLKYNIISSTDVEVVAGTEKYTGDIVIPSQTTIDGKTYNVTKIGIQAFNGCAGLTSITIPSSVYIIADESIYDCSGLKSITIPSSVTSIGNYVLGLCPNITSIKVESGNAKYDSRNNCNAIIETSTNTLIAGCKKTVIPSSVSIIGTAAFNGSTGLTSITIPSSVVSLGEGAFFECTGLTSISIPNSVTSIGENVFAYCENLKTATLSNKIKTISFSAFSGCYSLTGIEIPNSVTTIDEEAFSYCESITNITIGENVNSIGKCAFMSCNGLSRISTLNPTPPTCGENVFKNVNVSNVTLTVPTGSVSIYKSADIWKDFKYEQTEEEPSEPELPTDNSGLSYNILNSTEVEVIAGAEKYTGDIVIPSQTTIDGKVYNVTKVGDKAFYECTGLISITIPNSVTSISNYAYFGCTGLTSVTIPNSVTSIGNYAFSGCNGLTIITISNSVTSIGDNAFGYCSGLTSVTIPNSVTFIGAAAFRGCSGLTSITISERVTIIGESAFSDCSGLESIYVESENTVYDSRDNCNAIIEKSTNKLITGCKNSVIPNSVTSIGSWAFSGCSGLTRITIPNSVTSIGSRAFSGCSGLTSITIPNSVTSIGDFAFTFCSGLTSVIIGSSVTSIDNFAFYYCSGLSSVISLSTTPPMCGGTDVFGYVSVENITLEVPSVSVSLYQSADIWKRFGTIKGIVVEESGGSDNEEIISGYKITKQWTVPVDATTGQCSIRTATGYGDSLFGSNYQTGVIEEWKDGVLVASYDVNKFCADNQLGETDKVIDSETGTETEKFTSYVLWTAVMVDDAGNVLANVGTGLGSAKTCQNWVLLPASNRNAMQLLHIDEFPSADVTLGRVDVPSRIVGNITDGGAYLYIPATGSALMPVVYIGLDDAGKIYYDNDFSWVLPSGLSFDSSTNVATFQTADEILGAADEAGVAAKTYIRWRAQSNPFTWNAETSQFEKNTTIPQGASAAGMDVFKLGGVEYIVLPINSATTSMRGYSIGVYKLVDGSEVATWDAGTTNNSYVGSILARVNDDGKTANIYVCGWYECFGILKFEPESVSATSEKESMSFGNASSAIDEIVTEENTDVEYYNLQGVRVMNPEKGIYIKRQGGRTSKVVL